MFLLKNFDKNFATTDVVNMDSSCIIDDEWWHVYSLKLWSLQKLKGLLGPAHTGETNCLKHVAWNLKYLYDATNQYTFMEQSTPWYTKHMFLEIYFMKLINCVAWGNVAQLQTLSCFSPIQMERLQQIA